MAHLIDKYAVVAEIENRIKELQNLHKENEEKLDSIQKTSILLCIDECKVILSLLDILEVKEVDLDKLSISEQRIKYLIFEFLTGLQTFDTSLYSFADAYSKGIKDILKELGLKAQKGEYVYGYKMDW